MRRRSGYSLLEVLVSFAITALALAVILPQFGGLAVRGAESEERWRASEEARSHLASLGILYPLEPGVSVFELPDGSRMEVVITPHDHTETVLVDQAGLWDVVITVRRDRSERARLSAVLGEPQ